MERDFTEGNNSRRLYNLLLILFIIWIVLVIGVWSPFLTNKISKDAPESDGTKTFVSPDHSKILLAGYRYAYLYNDNLEKLGQFTDEFTRGSDISMADFGPIWDQSSTHVLLHNQYLIYVFDTSNFQLLYTLNKSRDLGLEIEVGQNDTQDRFFLEEDLHLQYVTDATHYRISIPTMNIETIGNIEHFNRTMKGVEFSSNGKYILFGLRNETVDYIYDRYIYDSKINQTYETDWAYDFIAPNKPYLAVVKIENYVSYLQFYDLETKAYGKKFVFLDSYFHTNNLAWSIDATSILRINREYYGLTRASPVSVSIFDIRTGKITFQNNFQSGRIYTNDPDSYGWLSPQKKLIIYSWSQTPGTNDYQGKVLTQSLTPVSMFLNNYTRLLFILLGPITAIMVVLYYLLINKRILCFLFRKPSETGEEFTVTIDEYIHKTRLGLNFLNIYYIAIAVVNISNRSVPDENAVPIDYSKIFVYSLTSYLDIAVIIVLGLIFLQVYSDKQNKLRIMGGVILLLILSLILVRISQGYSIGHVPFDWFSIFILIAASIFYCIYIYFVNSSYELVEYSMFRPFSEIISILFFIVYVVTVPGSI